MLALLNSIRILLEDGVTWFFASFKSFMFNGRRTISLSFSFIFEGSNGVPPCSSFFFS
jgi:hypothetical protein